MRFFPTADSLPNNFTALNLIFNKRLDLTNLRPFIKEINLLDIVIVNEQGKTFSKTPPFIGIMSVPTFMITNNYFGVKHLADQQIVFSEYHQYAGKISAAFYCALSAAILFLLLIRLKSNYKTALIITASYIFGTNIFNTASQVNWQHGISLFYICLFIYLIVSFPRKIMAMFVAGLILGILTQIRITNVFYMFFPLIFLARNRRFVILGFLLINIFVLFLYSYYQVPYGYSEAIFSSFKEISATNSIISLISIFTSYNFGLFFFSPFLVLSLLVLKKPNFLVKSLLPTLLLFIGFLSIYKYWLGGYSLNARLLTETLPIWIVMLFYAWQKYSPKILFKTIFFSLFLISIFFNLLTTYAMDWLWFPLYIKDNSKFQIQNAWYAKPTLLPHLLQSRLIHYEFLYKDKKDIKIRSVVFRPNLDTKSVVKFSDETATILKLN